MFDPKAKAVRPKKSGKPLTMVCVYRPKKGKAAAFLTQLRKHWPQLRKLGLATSTKPRAFRGLGKEGQTVFFELLEWRDLAAVKEAHGSPEVFEVWGPMGAVLEDMQFYNAEELDLSSGTAKRAATRRAAPRKS